MKKLLCGGHTDMNNDCVCKVKLAMAGNEATVKHLVDSWKVSPARFAFSPFGPRVPHIINK
jgi:hypothetical protein